MNALRFGPLDDGRQDRLLDRLRDLYLGSDPEARRFAARVLRRLPTRTPARRATSPQDADQLAEARAWGDRERSPS